MTSKVLPFLFSLLVSVLPLSVVPCPGVSTNEVHLDCDEAAKANHRESLKTTTPLTEYFKEHEVSESESRAALDALDLDQIARVPAWCDECSAEKIHFCHSAAFINDHCCCEHRHARDKLPWIPHTCYLGKERCQPHTSSCSKYREIRECCCDRLLIAEYKMKFSAGTRPFGGLAATMASWIVSTAILTTNTAIRFGWDS
ncbi:uncharacterized protein LOC120424046 [Culex pipiens pallens]|uniref:uncharacterized protein LOC120424046 n=1 Tax=Culex pipiens pallens TaxID=42434 RepID=UPI001952DE46|nr:uncharacterized protein LOC120424046 [Culex pipiens pallens]